MALTIDAKYDFSVCFVRITPLNDDLTQPEPSNIIGGVGPFDYSGEASAAAIPFKSKIDTGAVETVNIDLSLVSDISAVTVSELVSAINTAAPTDLTASAEAVTGRLKIAYSGTGSPSIVQVYGPAATIADIGQGKGVRVVSIDTMQSISDAPIVKDEETFTTTNANGVDTEVISDGYRKGISGSLTDTARSWLARSIIEGGNYEEESLIYTPPTSATRKIYFKLEIFNAIYDVGTQKEANRVGYVQQEIYSCKGTFGDRTRERGFTNWVYNYTATVDSNIGADSKETELTVAQYEALELDKISA